MTSLFWITPEMSRVATSTVILESALYAVLDSAEATKMMLEIFALVTFPVSMFVSFALIMAEEARPNSFPSSA